MDNIPYDIIAKYYSGEADDKEIAFIESWQSESADNKKIMEEYTLLWQAKDGDNFHPDVEDALSKVSQKLSAKPQQKEETTTRTLKPRNPIYNLYKIAAILILAFGVGMGYIYLKKNQADLYVSVTTSAKEKQEITLHDGTIITLNENSTLTYPKIFNKNSREVELEGEAFFEVHKAGEWPFYIKTEFSQTKVVGTVFNVFAPKSAEKVVVTVQEGKVLFADIKSKEKEMIALEAGDFGELIKNGKVEKKKNANPNYASWKTGAFFFKDMALKDVVKHLEAYYHVPIKVDEKVASRKMYGEYENRSLDDIIKFIKAANEDLKVEKGSEGYVIELVE